MYQALYRKWRPKTFDDVVGQAHVSETLKNQISSNRLSHAYLFVGTRGTGKTSCAKILAKAVNCQRPQNGNPCNECPNCIGIDNASILDVLELDAASNNGVDNVRALREEAVFTPVNVKKRVYIIDEVHMLSTPAFNALLKILEEPPEHLIFILATTEIHKVPATILSRCQRYMFKRILPQDIANRLLDIAHRENIELTNDAADLLARLADGSLRDALSLLDQCAAENAVDTDRVLATIGLAGGAEITGLLGAVADGNVPDALERLDRLYAGGKAIPSVLEELLNLVRDTLVMALMPKGGSGLFSGGYDEQSLSAFAGRVPEERLLTMMELLRHALMDVSKGSGGKLAAEICLIRLSGIQTVPSQPVIKNAVIPPVNKAQEAPKAPAPKPVVSAADSAPVEKLTQNPVEKIEKESAKEQPTVDDASRAKSAAQPMATAPTAELWAAVLEYVRPKIDIPPYSFLCDTANTAADLDGDTLTVKLKSAFAAKIVNILPVTEALKEASASLLGKPVAVKIIQDTGEQAGGNDKLDTLRRYSNIKFE